MRIIACYYTVKPGGLCKRLFRLLNASVAAHHEVYFVTLDPPPSHTLSEKVTVIRIPFPIRARRGLIFWGLFTVWLPLVLAWTLRRVTPDRCLAFGAYYGGMFKVATLFRSTPVILFLRSLVFRIDELTQKTRVVRWCSCLLDRFAIRHCERVVSMTEAMQREVALFAGRAPKSAAILKNDLPPPSPHRRSVESLLSCSLPDAAQVIITSGVLDVRKNVRFLIDAYLALPELHETTRLIIAGEGSELPALRAAAAGCDSILFTGWVEDLQQYLWRASVVVHPSLHEGIANSLLEALAEGVPVLASDIPEHREILSSSALLFPLDDPARLQQLLRDLLLLPSSPQRDTVRAASRSAAAALSFDWDARALALIEQLEERGGG